MYVGVATLVFHLPGARTLKDKRSIVLSIKDRIRAKFHVSCAEIEAMDLVQRSVLGVAVVSNDAAQCDEVLASVRSLAGNARDAVLTDVSTELLTVHSDLPRLD